MQGESSAKVMDSGNMISNITLREISQVKENKMLHLKGKRRKEKGFNYSPK